MKKILCVIMCLLSVPALAKIEVHFSPSQNCEKAIIDSIVNAQSSIDAAIYTFTHKNIASALKKAHAKGVKIRMITDASQSDIQSSKAPALFKAGIPIKINTQNRIEHNKFIIIDGKKLITGSYNWTYSASQYNSENCMIITQDDETISSFENRFNTLWKLYDQQQSDEWFKSLLGFEENASFSNKK